MKAKIQQFASTQNRITILAILAFLVAMCCIFAFAGNKTDKNEDNNSEASQSINLTSQETDDAQLETLHGYGIYVDGKFVAAVNEVSSAKEQFNTALSNRVKALGIESTVYSINNSVEYIEGDYEAKSFASFNVNAETGVITAFDGKVLDVKFAVRTTDTYTQNVVVEHAVKVIYTDGMPDGATKVVDKGYDGEGVETHTVIYVDGVEVTRDVTTEIISEPVEETVKIGSRSKGKVEFSMGTFIKPYDGLITSYVGSRWGRSHNGIDIVAFSGDCYKDPAVAAADGVVVKSEWYGGYGNCVIIDHGNGIQSYYAHFTTLCVSEGDVVKAGDVVGLIGSTGNSTGNHLHFEIRVDGEVVNPLLFVDYN